MEMCHAGQLFIGFPEEVLLQSWDPSPDLCGSVQGGHEMEPPEGNNKSLPCLVHTSGTLAGCTWDIGSTLPMADNYLDHTNTSSYKVFPWAGKGQILKCLGVQAVFPWCYNTAFPCAGRQS